MKSIITKLAFFLLIITLTSLVNSTSAQPPRPPHGPPPSGTPIGGNAPIDGGMSIVILLSAAYGTKKYFFKKEA
jgi:hypothetical protein